LEGFTRRIRDWMERLRRGRRSWFEGLRGRRRDWLEEEEMEKGLIVTEKRGLVGRRGDGKGTDCNGEKGTGLTEGNMTGWKDGVEGEETGCKEGEGIGWMER